MHRQGCYPVSMSSLSGPLLLLFLAACSEPPTDADGDGAAGDDCDDSNDSVYPGADELCNGIDDDCDGSIDENPGDGARLYADTDGDGFGDPFVSAWTCSATGLVTDLSDCDDSSGSVYPGADELCNGTDDDCDGTIDNDPIDPQSWYADADGDGYGAGASIVEACEQPSGAVSTSDDCNDRSVLINPGADEVWYDGVDQDCAGGDDYDADGDGYSLEDDCDDGRAAVSPDATEVCNDGLDNDCDGTLNGCGVSGGLSTSEADQSWTGTTAYGRAGISLAPLGDSDGDGVPELAIGAPYDGSYGGRVYVVPADSDGALSSTASATLDGTLYSYAGTSIDAFDADGDGYDDLLIGASGYRSGTASVGAAFIAYGPHSGSISLSSDARTFTGSGTYASAGFSVSAVGDIDGDGLSEALVGAPYDSSGGVTYEGAAYLLLSDGLLSGSSSASLADSDIILRSGTQYGYFGYYSAGVGDVDGDGLGDIAISGSVTGAEVFTGLVAGDYDADDSTASYTIAYATLSGLGDLDGDGYDDFSVGTGQAGTSTGTLYILYGPPPSSLSAASAILTGSGLSSDAASAGDIDGDGDPELLVGSGVSATAYLVPGTLAGSHTVTDVALATIRGTSGDFTGGAVAPAGDVDGDGFDDLVVSAYGASGYAGAVYLFYGGGL
ncbi:MAG: hypothetical protein ACI8S6_000666 [Myxococcota bacterium]|jgi:hypothetical protein